MRPLVIGLSVFVLLGLAAVDQARGEETVVVACAVGSLVPGAPSAFVISCDKSAGVPGVCPVFTGNPEEPFASCAQTLAFFLSLPGYKLVNVQSSSLGPVYTLVGPARNRD